MRLEITLEFGDAVKELLVVLSGHLLLARLLFQLLHGLELRIFHLCDLSLALFDRRELKQLLLNILEHSKSLVLLVTLCRRQQVLHLVPQQCLLHFLLHTRFFDDFLLDSELHLSLAQLLLIVVALAVLALQLLLVLVHLLLQVVDFSLVPLQVGHQLRLDRL